MHLSPPSISLSVHPLKVEAAEAALLPAVLATLEEDSPTARLASCRIVSHFVQNFRDKEPDKLLKVYPGRTHHRAPVPVLMSNPGGRRVGG